MLTTSENLNPITFVRIPTELKAEAIELGRAQVEPEELSTFIRIAVRERVARLKELKLQANKKRVVNAR